MTKTKDMERLAGAKTIADCMAVLDRTEHDSVADSAFTKALELVKTHEDLRTLSCCVMRGFGEPLACRPYVERIFDKATEIKYEP